MHSLGNNECRRHLDIKLVDFISCWAFFVVSVLSGQSIVSKETPGHADAVLRQITSRRGFGKSAVVVLGVVKFKLHEGVWEKRYI